MVNREFWNGKKVFLTGDTGFKGSWLRLWLEDMGAIVRGYSLSPPRSLNVNAIFFPEKESEDLCDKEHLVTEMLRFDPDYVIHLAAQALLPLSYKVPIRTFESNIMGTANVLQCAQHCKGLSGILIITTDKVYGTSSVCDYVIKYFKEEDPLGGFDPYSVSKVCVEHIVKCYRNCFIKDIPIYVARAGNVIGGGDWAEGRLIPDIVRHIYQNKGPIPLRNPDAVRPWQHVFDVLSGYLTLLEQNPGKDNGWEWNFGPKEIYPYSVKDIVELFGVEYVSKEEPIHETSMLCLSSAKARNILGWETMDTIKALEDTKKWYELYYTNNVDMRYYSLSSLRCYESGEYFG